MRPERLATLPHSMNLKLIANHQIPADTAHVPHRQIQGTFGRPTTFHYLNLAHDRTPGRRSRPASHHHIIMEI